MENFEQDKDYSLELSLSCNPPKRARHSPPPQPMLPLTASSDIINNNNNNVVDDVRVNAPSPSFYAASQQAKGQSHSLRPCRAASQHTARQPKSKGNKSKQNKSEIISQPFPWATNRRATIQSLKYLRENEIFTITGSVECKRCKTRFEMGFNLDNKYAQIFEFTQENIDNMHDRAPKEWSNPVLPTCEHCGRENSVQPILADKKRAINWLFLFLGQMLGCCNLRELKYFLKHTKIHRTGSKDHVLYSAYICIFKQLVPESSLLKHTYHFIAT